MTSQKTGRPRINPECPKANHPLYNIFRRLKKGWSFDAIVRTGRGV